MTPVGPPARSSGSVRRLVAAVTAAVTAGLLLSCTGGSPAEPTQQAPATNTYVLAHVTLLDANNPCVPGDCAPEFYDCETLQPMYVGHEWTLLGDQATAGVAGDPMNVPTIVTYTAADNSGHVGLRVVLDVDPVASTATVGLGTSVNVDQACTRLNSINVQESLFLMTTAGTATVTSVETSGGLLVIALPSGTAGTYSPTGILEGTFHFAAEARQ